MATTFYFFNFQKMYPYLCKPWQIMASTYYSHCPFISFVQKRREQQDSKVTFLLSCSVHAFPHPSVCTGHQWRWKQSICLIMLTLWCDCQASNICHLFSSPVNVLLVLRWLIKSGLYQSQMLTFLLCCYLNEVFIFNGSTSYGHNMLPWYTDHNQL